MTKPAKIAVSFMSALVVIVAVVIYLWIPRKHTQTSEQSWQAVLKKCADTNLLGRNVVYFGASNTVGPGSVWRRGDDGAYHLFLDLPALEPDPEKRKQMVVLNNTVTCQGVVNSKWNIALGLPFESQATALKADISADLKRASDINVGIAGYELDELKEGLFETLIQGNARLYQNPRSFVIASNAIKVTGFSADFIFPESVATELRPKYQNNVIALKEGATLKSDWSSNTTLKLTAAEPFYMLAGYSNVALAKNGKDLILADMTKPSSIGSSDKPINIDQDIESQFKAVLAAQGQNPAKVRFYSQGQVINILKCPSPDVCDQAAAAAYKIPDVRSVRAEFKNFEAK